VNQVTAIPNAIQKRALVSFFVFCVTLPTLALAASPKNSTRLTDFTTVIVRCLKAKNISCLEKHITRDLNFPEHKTFGCQTERPGKITPYEFALCAMKSKVKCTDIKPKIKAMALNDVLNECFTNPKSISSEDQIITRSGYVCRLEDVNHELFLSSVAIQDHLSGFEENVPEESLRVRDVKKRNYDF
jgi:hypothetical protein